jgi:hypothetical protein
MKDETTTIQIKEFGNFRVQYVLSRSGRRVLITDKKACDRLVVKLEATSIKCFNSVTEESIVLLAAILSSSPTFKKDKQSFAKAIQDYIYGTIDLVTSIEWINPYAEASSC